MLSLISFLFAILHTVSSHRCSSTMPHAYQHSYLCREKLNSTTLRIRLHLRVNDTEYAPNVLVSYRFTLRTLDLVEENRITLEERFERPITNVTTIDIRRRENHSVSIQNLYPGRYEVCVNFFDQKRNVFYRSANSCLHVPWYVPESELNRANPLIQVSLLISIILLLASIAFVGYSIHQYINAGKTPISTADDDGNDDDEPKDEWDNDRVKFIVNQHFGEPIRPYENLIQKRLRQRYAHRSPDLEDSR